MLSLSASHAGGINRYTGIFCASRVVSQLRLDNQLQLTSHACSTRAKQHLGADTDDALTIASVSATQSEIERGVERAQSRSRPIHPSIQGVSLSPCIVCAACPHKDFQRNYWL